MSFNDVIVRGTTSDRESKLTSLLKMNKSKVRNRFNDLNNLNLINFRKKPK